MASIPERKPVSTPAKKRINFDWALPPCEKCGQKHPPPPHPRSKDCEKVAASLKSKPKRSKWNRKPNEDLSALTLEQMQALRGRKKRRVYQWWFAAPWPDIPRDSLEWFEYQIDRWELLNDVADLYDIADPTKRRQELNKRWNAVPYPKYITREGEFTEHPITQEIHEQKSQAGRKGARQTAMRLLERHRAVEKMRDGVFGDHWQINLSNVVVRLILLARTKPLTQHHYEVKLELLPEQMAELEALARRCSKADGNTVDDLGRLWDLARREGPPSGKIKDPAKYRPNALLGHWSVRTLDYHMQVTKEEAVELQKLFAKPKHKIKPALTRQAALMVLDRKQRARHLSTSVRTLQRGLLIEYGITASIRTVHQDLLQIRGQASKK